MKSIFILLILLTLYGCKAEKVQETAPPPPAAHAIFSDITEQSGLRFTNDPAVEGEFFYPEIMGFGCAFLDYNNDGKLDIYLLNGAWRKSAGKPALKNRLFRQEPDGRFRDVTDASGLAGGRYSQGVAVGDIDNDGDVDVFLGNYGPDALYRNNGDGTFTDITATARISDDEWGASAAFLDYNRDGFLDLYVANYVSYDATVACTDRAGRRDYCGPGGFRGAPDLLYRNQGDGTFRDVSKEAGIAGQAWKGLGVVSADFNNDGWQDIYVANDGEINNLWINQKNGTFTDQGVPMGAAVNILGQPEASMGIAMGDVQGDGHLDLLLTHLRNETNTLYRGAGSSGFRDETAASGLGGPSLPYTGFGTGFFDFDHDGDLDVPVANGRVTRGPLLTGSRSSWADDYAEPNLFFENKGNGRFEDISSRVPAFTAKIENSRGLAFGDVDNDGDVDLVLLNAGGPARLLRNDAPGKGHWLLVRAVDPQLKRDAVGAVITVVTATQRILRVVTPTFGYESSSDPRAHFGLGADTAYESIEVRWPDGAVETFPGGPANRSITLEEKH